MDSGADNRADAVITTMVAAAMGGAIVPAVVQWPIFASAMGAGVVGIGLCYGVQLTKDEAWKLIVQFIRAAGLTFAGLYIGSQILSLILTSTGIGYVGAVAMDATIAGAIAYAVGAAAKAYFQGERNTARLGQIMRQTFKQHKA
jgi:Domain of unknown function (DUF697)